MRKVSDKVAMHMAALAVNASNPMGTGFMHYTPKRFQPDQFADSVKGTELHLDYVEGRMVKLRLSRDTDGQWKVPEWEPRADYQSWCREYPTYAALADAAEKVAS